MMRDGSVWEGVGGRREERQREGEGRRRRGGKEGEGWREEGEGRREGWRKEEREG